jgi:hypothetical protein
MPTIATVRPYTKTDLPTLTDESRFLTDSLATGVRSTRWADFRTQLDGRYAQLTQRNAANGYAGVAADGLLEPSIMRAALVPEEVASDAAKNALVVAAGDVGKRLVRVTATGINYLAAATGTGASKWVVYNTIPAATEATSGIAEIATDAEADAETDDARIMSPLKTSRQIKAKLNPIAASRAPLDGILYSDGASANRRAEWAMGAAGNLAGSPITVTVWLRVPTADTALEWVIFGFGTSGTLVSGGNNGLSLNCSAVGALNLRNSTDNSNRGAWTIAGWRAANAGKWVRLDFVSQGDTATFPALYQDGVLLTGWTQFVAAGTIPNWQAPTLSSAFYIAAGSGPATEIVPGAILNRALTQAEIMTMIETNALLPRDRLGGSAVGLVTNTGFEVDMTGYASTNGATSFSRITSDSRSGTACAEAVTSSTGQPVRIDIATPSNVIIAGTFWAKSVSGNTSLTVARGNGGNAQTVILTTSWQQFFYVSTVGTENPSVSTSIIGWTLGGAGTFRLDDVQAWRVGAILNPEITRAAQVLDFGLNRIRGICTAGVRPFSTRPPVPLRGNQTATGFALGLGSTDPLWFENGLITGLRIKQAAATAQTITLRLNSSGGTTIATATTAASTDWQVIALSPDGGFEVASGDRLHWTLSGPVVLDWDLTWTRR